jgi:hypothetical protein
VQRTAFLNACQAHLRAVTRLCRLRKLPPPRKRRRRLLLLRRRCLLLLLLLPLLLLPPLHSRAPMSSVLQAAAASRIKGKPDIIAAAISGDLSLVRDHLTADPSCVGRRDET